MTNSFSMAKALRVIRILLAVMTIAVCLLLCWQAIDIYLTGNRPENFSAPGVYINPVYSREIVEERLTAIAPVLYVYLAVVVIGLILQTAGRKQQKTPTANRLADAAAPSGKSFPVWYLVLYIAAAALIALGIFNGGLRDVLIKAINICTECIGLG